MSLMDEMYIVHGHKTVHGNISYVPQDAWVLSTTLRENVLMGKELDADKYKQAIESTSLVQVMT